MINTVMNKVLQNDYSSNLAVNEKLLEVLFIAEKLLGKHKFKAIEIVFCQDFSLKGSCSGNSHKISLQLDYCIHQEIEAIQNTILHEIAHAICGTENGHNIIWQEKAKELGVKWDINYRK
jgi:hypothetical protein